MSNMRSRLISMSILGLILAIVFLAAVQIFQTLRVEFISADDRNMQAVSGPESFAPVFIQSVSEEQARMSIKGTSEPDTIVHIQNFGQGVQETLSDSSGAWFVEMDIAPEDLLEITIYQIVLNDNILWSDEIIYRIPPPPLGEVLHDPLRRALIMVAAPGGPSSVFQSPFPVTPASDHITMGSIDYDESGGVIFSGTSSYEGRVRVSINDTAVGERRVTNNGRWYIIAADTLPQGQFDIMAEFVSTSGNNSSVSVPFERNSSKSFKNTTSLEVQYEPYGWQVRRSLVGGGNQYTAIFAPDKATSITQN